MLQYFFRVKARHGNSFMNRSFSVSVICQSFKIVIIPAPYEADGLLDNFCYLRHGH